MHLRTGAGMALLALVVGGSALAAATHKQFEGGVTLYEKGHDQMVVCSVDSPYLCNMIRLYGGTKTVLAANGKPAKLARGEYVSVDAAAQPGAPVALTVRVYPDRAVRTIKGFKPASTQRDETVLKRLPGVRAVKLMPELGEVYLTFNSKTSAADIAKRAKRKGIQLVLPGA
ncbi:MAG TPA: hypothetical protein VFJ58_23530 [Armatimonadota bacterium]|nr:hypothetical protein [Armatimonadota bacterium]